MKHDIGGIVTQEAFLHISNYFRSEWVGLYWRCKSSYLYLSIVRAIDSNSDKLDANVNFVNPESLIVT